MSTPCQIRDAFVVAITSAATEARPWHEVHLPADLYESLAPELSEPQSHYGFAVLPRRSEGTGARGPLVTTTEVLIKWSRTIGADPDRCVYDQRAALQDEESILAAVLDLAPHKNAALRSIDRKHLDGESSGLFVGTIIVAFPHQYSQS